MVFFMPLTSFPADVLTLPRPLVYLGATLLLLRVWRAVLACLDFTHSLSDLCLDLLVVFVAESLEKQNIIPVYLPKLSFIFHVFPTARFPSVSSPSYLSSFAQSPVFHFISLFLCLPSAFSPECRCIPPLPLPFTPSQDKQPLYWGMSAICSKRLLDAVQTRVSEGRKAYKFSTFSQSLPLFFIFLGRRYPTFFFFSRLSHDFIPHLKLIHELRSTQPSTLYFTFLLLQPLWLESPQIPS